MPSRPSPVFQRPRLSPQSMAVKMALAIIALSVVRVLLPASLGNLLPLVPGSVVGALAVWQPLTYIFLAGEPLGVLFGALIVWSIGTSLEQTWGSRRLFLFAVGVTAIAGVLTVALSLVWPTLLGFPFFGAGVVTSALWVAYGLSHGGAQVNFWGLPLTGNMFALVGVGFVALQGAFYGFAGQMPDVFALLLTYGYVQGFRPRMLWLRFQNWRLRRQMRTRSRHLHVITPDRNTSKDSDRYRH